MAIKCPIYGVAISNDCLECDDKICKSIPLYKYKKVVVGLDQSYQTVGVCIIADGVKKHLRPIHLGAEKTNSKKRKLFAKELDRIIRSIYLKAEETICIIERIRLHSGGFVNINYIKSIGALNAIIIDKFNDVDIKVYSVDTRAWKAQIVGTSKPAKNQYGVPELKWPTVKWCIDQGWEEDILVKVEGRKKKNTFMKGDIRYRYDDDTADAAGIAMFGFKGDPKNLKLEE